MPLLKNSLKAMNFKWRRVPLPSVLLHRCAEEAESRSQECDMPGAESVGAADQQPSLRLCQCLWMSSLMGYPLARSSK